MLDFEKAIPHDSIIEAISIDRTHPGKNDVISIDLLMNDNKKYKIDFIDVYHAQFELNFGVIADESIREVSVELHNDKIVEIVGKWRKIGINIDDLKCFVVATNSTNSKLKIYAKGFRIN